MPKLQIYKTFTFLFQPEVEKNGLVYVSFLCQLDWIYNYLEIPLGDVTGGKPRPECEESISKHRALY